MRTEREVNIVITVPADWEDRLDMQSIVEREVAADNWVWNWPDHNEIEQLRARIAELESNDGDCFTGMLVEIDGHTYGLRPGAARIVKEAMASSDPYLDGTDNAHPAWWRGYDYGFIGAVAGVTRILDGKDDGLGVANEPWQSVRTRLREALRDAGRYRWMRYDGDGPANAIAAAVAEGDNEHGGEYVSWLYGDELDAAIDAEMAKDGA